MGLQRDCSNCRDGQGRLCGQGAEGWIVDPEGCRRGAMCREHALACIEEYARVLEECWQFVFFTPGVE